MYNKFINDKRLNNLLSIEQIIDITVEWNYSLDLYLSKLSNELSDSLNPNFKVSANSFQSTISANYMLVKALICKTIT